MHKTYLSNGPMKPFNRKPKDLKRDSKGFSDPYYTTFCENYIEEYLA